MSGITVAQVHERAHAALIAEAFGWHVTLPTPDLRWLHLLLDGHPSGWELVVMWTAEGRHVTAGHADHVTLEQSNVTIDGLDRLTVNPDSIRATRDIDLDNEVQ